MTKMPPVPPQNRSPREAEFSNQQQDNKQRAPERPENLAEQDRQANIKQNTTNQGYQQDR